MTTSVVYNNAYSTLNGAILSSDTTIVVNDGTSFPTVTAPDYAFATLQDSSNHTEIVKITAHSAGSATFTVVRAQETSFYGTTSGYTGVARNFANGSVFEMRLTAGTAVTVDGTQTLTNKTLTSPTLNTSVLTGSTTLTAFAGATTLLTIGGTGATAVVALPGTLQQSGTTGALTVAGGAYIAKNVKTAGNLTATSGLFAPSVTSTGLTLYNTVQNSYLLISDDGVSTASLAIALNNTSVIDATDTSISLKKATTFTGHVTVEGVTSTGATGTGKLVFDTSPTLVTPALGTPSALVGTNITGTATGFTAGAANGLKSATTTVDTSAATAPSAGQVLVATNSTTATWTTSPFPAFSQITNALGSDVALNNTANFFTGPTIAQGVTGTWYATGHVTVKSTAAGAGFCAKLWDGSTVIAATVYTTPSTNHTACLHLSGYIASPAGNIRISVRDLSDTSGVIVFNDSGTSKDSVLSAIRIA
jgi:hypothetical protein